MTKRQSSITAITVLAIIAVCVIVISCIVSPAKAGTMDPLTVTILKVGKADAIILQCQDETMIIDTGEEDDGLEVTEFLSKRNITYVDTLIITHFDKDHVGGADTVVESVDVGQVLLPDYEGADVDYVDFIDALSRKNITPTRLDEPIEFTLGEAQVLVEPPISYEIPEGAAEFDNNFSLITTVTHGDNKLLFTGDAEKRLIRDWLANGSAGQCDFLKVPHHGIYTTALDELLDVVQPKYAAICSSAKHPADDETLEALKGRGVDVLETRNGKITVISDGINLELHQKVKKGSLI